MRNTLGDLNNHLFAQLERLSDEELQGDKLKEELQRSKAIEGIAREIISNADIVLKARKHASDYTTENIPKMLEG